MPRSALPDHLKDKAHNDYVWPLSYIPRAWTSYKLTQPPTLIIGSPYLEWSEKFYKDRVRRRGPDPVQHIPWAWALTWPLHFTIAIPLPGRHNRYIKFRIGCRWDTIDDYYTVPALDISIGNLIDNTQQHIVYDRGDARI